jgi:signal peptidase I
MVFMAMGPGSGMDVFFNPIQVYCSGIMSDLKENSAAGNSANPVGKFKYYLEQTLQLVLALIVVFAIRSSLVEPFKIPSGSMIPTLYVGDFIFVNKFAYGFHIPFSEYLGDKKMLVKRDPPKRGDVIVFRYPKDPSLHYIKRVMGVPGDVIELRNKVVYVNGSIVPESEVDSKFRADKLRDIGDSRYGDSHMHMYQEKVDGHDHLMMTDANNDYTNSFGPITVTPDSLFVMGDNRDFSNDSRFWGFVPMDNVSGRAEVIWLSMWINFSESSENAFRPGRIGTLLR